MEASRSVIASRLAWFAVALAASCAALGAAAPSQSNAPPAPGRAAPAQQQPAKAAALPIQITPSPAMFGDIAPNSTHPARFTLRNTGSKALTVKSVKPSCKCTGISDIVGQVIPVGGEIPLEASLKAPPVPGAKDAKVFIEVEEMKGVAIALLEGNVVMPILADPPFVDALKGVGSGTIALRSADGKPFRVLSAGGGPPPFEGFDPAKDEPRSTYTLKWNLAGVEQPPIWWMVETDRADCPLLPLRVRHENTGSRYDMERLTRFWWVKDQIVMGGIMVPNKPMDIVVELEHYNPRGGNKVTAPQWREVRSIKSGSPLLSAEIVDVKPIGDDGVEVTVRVTAKEGASGLVASNMSITTATGDGPVPFFARVVTGAAAPTTGK